MIQTGKTIFRMTRIFIEHDISFVLTFSVALNLCSQKIEQKWKERPEIWFSEWTMDEKNQTKWKSTMRFEMGFLRQWAKRKKNEFNSEIRSSVWLPIAKELFDVLTLFSIQFIWRCVCLFIETEKVWMEITFRGNVFSFDFFY